MDIKASSLDAFLSHLNAGKERRFEELRFEAPRRSSEQVWSALSRAVLDPAERMLSLTWCDAHSSNDTDVFYGKRRLDVRAADRIHGFELDDVHGALTTRPKDKTNKAHLNPGHCPIEVPLVEQMLIDTFEGTMTPEEWLALLGRDPGEGVARGGAVSRGKSKHDTHHNSYVFEASDQVRDLAARLRHTLQQLRAPWSEADGAATLRMLTGVFDNHSPSALDLLMAQRIWRAWLRAELTRFATTAAKDPEVKSQGLSQKLRDLALDFQKRLDLQPLPLIVRKQIRFVAWGVT